MANLAFRYLAAADVLATRFGNYGDGATHLNVLAFEISLKAVSRINDPSFEGRHNYKKIWKNLPQATRQKILENAKYRHGSHAKLDDIEKVLSNLEIVFSKGRYDYEFNFGLTEAEIRSKGENWIANGALPENADIHYHPWECDALIYGIFQELEKYLETEFDINHFEG